MLQHRNTYPHDIFTISTLNINIKEVKTVRDYKCLSNELKFCLFLYIEAFVSACWTVNLRVDTLVLSDLRWSTAAALEVAAGGC